ncbi:unnamed protein product [Boreogadus saida]
MRPTIKGLPDAPRLTTPKEPVVEGTPVELGCSAPSYCDTHPPTVTWTPALGLSTQLQQNDTGTSTLTFNASHLQHGNNVSCTAAYYISSGNEPVNTTRYQLSILFAPRNTSAVGSPCLPAREGGCLNLTCTSHANPAVSEFTWYRIHGEQTLKIGSGSSLSIQLFNANNVFFCEARNYFGPEKSNVFEIDIQAPPRILSSSSCSRIAAWVRCSCDSVGRPSPSLEWWLDGKLVLGSKDVSVSQVNLENATLRSSLIMRAPAGLTALTCHSSNAAGNTRQELPVPHLDTQPTLTEKMPWIAAIAVLAAGLLFATVCALRAWKMANQTGLGKDALHNKAPPNQGKPQNTVGPREEPVGEGAVTAAGSSALTQRDSEEAADPAADRAWKMANQTGLGSDALINKAPPNVEYSQLFFKSGADTYATIDTQKNTVGPGEKPVGLGEEAAGPREEAVTAAGSSALTQRDSEEAADPAADCDVLYTTVNWKKMS